MFLFMKQKLFDSAADSRRQEYRTQIPDFRAVGRSKVESRGSRAESSRDSRGAVITVQSSYCCLLWNGGQIYPGSLLDITCMYVYVCDLDRVAGSEVGARA